jgi:hypothetical protein
LLLCSLVLCSWCFFDFAVSFFSSFGSKSLATKSCNCTWYLKLLVGRSQISFSSGLNRNCWFWKKNAKNLQNYRRVSFMCSMQESMQSFFAVLVYWTLTCLSVITSHLTNNLFIYLFFFLAWIFLFS